MNIKKLSLAVVLIVAVVSFFSFDLGQYLSLEYFESKKEDIFTYSQNHPFQTAGYYFAIYIVVTALSLPAAAVITLIGGAIFGLGLGTLLVSFASTIGATLAFLFARTLFRDYVEKKFAGTLRTINTGVEKEGAFYLFGLRLVPLFPFFAINLLMGLTKMATWRYFLVSQLGMLPGTIVFVNAGTQLAQINSLGDITSPTLLLSFALLGLFPLIAKRILTMLQARKIYKEFDKPKQFDTNMVVIGAGSAGLVTSYIAAATKANVILVEKHKMGGDCLNTGCVPSKALIRSAKIAHYCNSADEFGISVQDVSIDFERVMTRIQEVIHKIEPHDSVERYTSLGVNCIEGEATIIDPYRVQVNGKVITTRNIVIATGARPAIPKIEGIASIPYYTSDTIWGLKDKPKTMLILGSGPIGCELAQAFHRLGIKVSILNRSNKFLPKEDPEISGLVKQQFIDEGISLYLGYSPVKIVSLENGHQVTAIHEGQEKEISFDCLLVATGRQANTGNIGLENLGIETNHNGTVSVNEYLQTKYPNVLACGDVAGPYQFTHVAAHQAWYASVNALFGKLKKFKVDYRVIPWATFTDPEIARVGLNEHEAKQQGLDYEVTRYGIDDLDRAIADGQAHGEVKVLTQLGKDKIIGVTIVGYHAGELINEFISAMKHGYGMNKILGTIHIYPTLSESNKFAAGEWKRNHVPEFAMKYLSKWHSWQRKA